MVKFTQKQLEKRFRELAAMAEREALMLGVLMNEIHAVQAAPGFSLPAQLDWDDLYRLAADGSARDYWYRAAETLKRLGTQAIVTDSRVVDAMSIT